MPSPGPSARTTKAINPLKVIRPVLRVELVEEEDNLLLGEVVWVHADASLHQTASGCSRRAVLALRTETEER